jgi:glucan 1,3-beta-glucosidase
MKVTLTFAAIVLPFAAVAMPTVPLVNGCLPLGCYNDQASYRALAINTQVANGLTDQSPEACTAACIANGLAFAGVENGGECWCGAFINNGQTLAADQSLCNMPCTGAADEICGGAGGINIYDCTQALPIPEIFNDCVPLGCYTDSVSYRTLATNTQVEGGPNNQSPEVCTAACIAAGFRYAGNEYGGECWCGNSIDNGGAPAPDINEQCQMRCHGNSSLFCGGPDHLNLYDCPTSV